MDVQKCELRGSDGMSGHARVGPPGSVFQCDLLDDTFLGSKEDLRNFAAKFEAINKEAKA